MKTVFIILLAAVLLLFARISESAVETYRDTYTAELAAEQMNTDGSEEYMVYSSTLRKMETVETSARVTVFIYGAAATVYGIYKIFNAKE